jgi:hypothetical protein
VRAAPPELSAKDQEVAQGWVSYILATETQEAWEAACNLCLAENAARPDFVAYVVEMVNTAAAPVAAPVAATVPPVAKAPPKPAKAPATHSVKAFKRRAA